MLVGVIRGEAVYSGLLEVSITMCICTKWLGKGLRLGVYSAAFCRDIISIASFCLVLTSTGLLRANPCGNIGDRQGI